MDIFFTYLKKTLVATMFVIFGLVGTYIPQVWNDDSNIQQAEAGDEATRGWQITALIEQAATAVSTAAIEATSDTSAIMNTLSAAYDEITSWATENLWFKEYVLDGLAWHVAKMIISSMVDSLVSWINSGFKGSPHFVQDLLDTMTNAADEAIGEYIQDLGSLGSFICSPFKLDIQIAVSTQYNLSRVDQHAADCTLTGTLANITDFTSGAQGSFSQGGWNSWFDITSSPEVYTKYGSYLTAEAGASAKIRNAKGEELSLLNFGSGFLSGEVCKIVHSVDTSREECVISKPGKIIEEALSFNLDSGRQSLVTADEIDEIIGALLGQIANQAIQGATGLLGLGSSYTPSSYTPLEGSGPSSFSRTESLADMENALLVQESFRETAASYKTGLQTFIENTDTDEYPDYITQANEAAIDAQTIINQATENIIRINTLIVEFNDETDTISKIEIFSSFRKLRLYVEGDILSTTSDWDSILALSTE